MTWLTIFVSKKFDETLNTDYECLVYGARKWAQMAKMSQKTNQKKLGFSNTHYRFITLNTQINKHIQRLQFHVHSNFLNDYIVRSQLG
jgi:hypothetical protein